MSRCHLLTATDIAALKGDSTPHPVNDKVRRVTKSLGDPVGLSGIGVHIFETAPGAESTALHVHHHEDEAIYVLSGEGEAQIGGDKYPVRAGDFIGCPKGGPAHILRNTGPEPLRCLVVGERKDHDVVEYPQARKRLTRTGGNEIWSDLTDD